MFLLFYLVFRSRKCIEKILFWSGPFFEKILGSELLWPPYCHRPLVPVLERGNAVRFFRFVFFWVWFGVFCRFFCRSSLLRVVVRKIFGSELLFLGVGVGLVCFGAVLPMFLLYFCFRRSRNCL